jgi:hypothetical protein
MSILTAEIVCRENTVCELHIVVHPQTTILSLFREERNLNHEGT